MSTVTRYNLRATRARASSLPQTPKMPGAAVASPIASHGSEMTPLSEGVMTPHIIDAPSTYSDVNEKDSQVFEPREVRSTPGLRLSSPVLPELSKSSSEIPDSRLNSSVVPETTGCVVALEDALGGAQGTADSLHVIVATAANDVDDANNDLDGGEWTTVMRKGRKRFTSQEHQREVGTLDAELQRAVKQAKARLTPDERQRIKKRQITVNQVNIRSQSSSESDTDSRKEGSSSKRRRSKKRQVAVNRVSIRLESPSESEPTSRGEGPSNLERGKGVDPRNWGDLSDASDINLEEQQTILESCNLARELAQVPDEVDTDSQQSDNNEGVELTNKRSERPIGKGKAAPAAPKIVPSKGSLQGRVDKGKGRTKNIAPTRSRPWSVMLCPKGPDAPSAQ